MLGKEMQMWLQDIGTYFYLGLLLKIDFHKYSKLNQSPR